jgi:hypothetical protein
MTDAQIEILRHQLSQPDVKVYYKTGENGMLNPVHHIQDEHRETLYPDEVPEPVVWLGDVQYWNSGCVSLWNAEFGDFVFFRPFDPN